MLISSLHAHPSGALALKDDRQSLTYGQLRDEIDRRTAMLRGVGALAITLDNGAEWVLWDLAALKAGVPCVPIPPFFTSEQTEHILRTVGASHIISSRGMLATGRDLSPHLPRGTAKVTFTSGTTGAPKGVCLSKDAMEQVAQSLVTLLVPMVEGPHLCALPLAVLLENIAGVYGALMAGNPVIMPTLGQIGRHQEGLHGLIQKSQAASVIVVPEMLRILMAQTRAGGPLPSLKFVAVGGSKVDPELVYAARKLGLPVYEGYGLSECASVVALNTPEHDKPGTVGRPLPHVSCTLKNGEVQVGNTGFLGYLGEPAPRSIDTGDLGTLDAGGFLSVTGRSKNVLITSYGRNVSPEWVEAALLAQPAIAQVIVHGDAAPHLSALLVPSGPSADVAAAIAAANANLPEYAQVKDYRAVSPFTLENGLLTGTGRPRRDPILSLYITAQE